MKFHREFQFSRVRQSDPLIRTIQTLHTCGVETPFGETANAPWSDEANTRFLDRFKNRVRFL
jgi:hypothetical protein